MNVTDNITIVLVNPKYPENIGSTCRAMKTMGIQSLALVSNNHPDREKIRILAVHAFDIMEQARFYTSLEEAVKKVSLVAGVSRRRGKKRKYFALSPEELATRIHTNPGQSIALVFGNEETGLTEKELACCQILVRIPSSPEFPSLNLSHAVQIITYTLFRAVNPQIMPGYTPISNEKLRYLVAVITGTLRNVGFFKLVDAQDLGLFFTDILARAGLSRREAKRLEVIFRKISGMVADKGVDIQERQ